MWLINVIVPQSGKKDGGADVENIYYNPSNPGSIGVRSIYREL
jgi:hypothetical protein